jgi:hypothetical protein
MKASNSLSMACAVGLLAVSPLCAADGGPAAVAGRTYERAEHLDSLAKSASASSIAARATATSTQTVFGGFALAGAATVYILVRGNSLGTLGVTQNYLDLPRVRIYNQQGADMYVDGSGRAGFNYCLSSNSFNAPVINYYNNVRHAPASSDDACLADTFPAGVYTFTVTPSISNVTSPPGDDSVPTSGEVLFEVTLGP